MKGKLIVLEGIDGSGKGTQCKLLFDRLTKEGFNMMTHSFPTYDSPAAVPSIKYLHSPVAHLIPPEVASATFACDRVVWAGKAKPYFEKGSNFLLDRYVSSNAGHQGGKYRQMQEWNSEKEFVAARNNFIQWLLDFEYTQLQLPQPDLTVFLDIHPVVSQQLILKKAARAYLEGKPADAHEDNLQHLIDARESYKLCADVLPNWQTVSTTRPDIPIETLVNPLVPAEEKMRSYGEINEEVYQAVIGTLKKPDQ